MPVRLGRGDLRITTGEGHELTLGARLHWRRRAKHLSGWPGTGRERGRYRPWRRSALKHPQKAGVV